MSSQIDPLYFDLILLTLRILAAGVLCWFGFRCIIEAFSDEEEPQPGDKRLAFLLVLSGIVSILLGLALAIFGGDLFTYEGLRKEFNKPG